MLAPEEELAVAEQFGVARAQVRRDHLISHLLATLSVHVADRVVFFGGTALCRSLLPNGRLSEDIDLIAVGRRRDVAGLIEHHLVRENRREFPGMS
jgi:predicted nucleotidyltransferase component of viral defense system